MFNFNGSNDLKEIVGTVKIPAFFSRYKIDVKQSEKKARGTRAS